MHHQVRGMNFTALLDVLVSEFRYERISNFAEDQLVLVFIKLLGWFECLTAKKCSKCKKINIFLPKLFDSKFSAFAIGLSDALLGKSSFWDIIIDDSIDIMLSISSIKYSLSSLTASSTASRNCICGFTCVVRYVLVDDFSN